MTKIRQTLIVLMSIFLLTASLFAQDYNTAEVNGYLFTFNGATVENGNTTFSYTVTALSNAEKEISHFQLELCADITDDVIISEKNDVEIIDGDQTSSELNFRALKFEKGLSASEGSSLDFSFTLAGIWGTTPVMVGYKAGSQNQGTNGWAGLIYGPSCEPVESCTGEIGDYVFIDNSGDCDGTQEDSTPIQGAEVQLTFGSTVLTTTTGIDGHYSFSGLCAGDYVVEILTVPENHTFSTAENYTVTLGAGEIYEDADFGFCPPSNDCDYQIGNLIWLDANCDGLQDVGEKGLSGIKVYLKDADGNILDETTTNQDGLYWFKNICEGTYYVSVEDISENYSITKINSVNDGTNDGTIDSDDPTGTVVIISGDSDDTIDFGFCANEEEAQVDIEVLKSASTKNLENGDSFSYTITVRNNGPDNATGVQVTDVLPTGLTLLSSDAEAENYLNGVWTVGNMANGDEFNLVLNVKADVNESSNSLIDLGVASDYNLFVHKNVTQPSSDTEGRAAIGGNANFANYSVGDKLAPNSGDVLVVGNNLHFVSGAIYNGNVVYGNNTNLGPDYYSVSITGGTLRQDNVIDFTTAFQQLLTLSANLFNKPVNGTTTLEHSSIFLTGNDPYLNVFKVKGDDLTAATNLEITVPNGAVALVNISGNDIVWSGGLVVHGTSIGNVLYNFKNATNLTIQGIDVRGSILAPRAHVNFTSGVQNGQMICRTLEGTGQFNNTKFVGNVPQDQELVNTVSVTCNEFDTNEDNNSAEEDVIIAFTYDNGNGNGNGTGDDDTNWELVGNFDATEIVWSMTTDNDGNTYIGTVGGNLYKIDAVTNEKILINEGMNVGWIWSIYFNENNGRIFVGTEQGMYRIKEDYSGWDLMMAGKDVRSVIKTGSEKLYSGTWGYGVFQYSFATHQWTAINDGLDNLAITSLTADSDGTLYAGTMGGGVYKYESNTWTKLDVGYDFIWSLAITSDNKLIAATYGGGVYASFNLGASWNKLNGGLEAAFVYAVSVDQYDNIYVSTWAGGVYKLDLSGTSDSPNSENWQPVGMGGYGVSSIMFNSTEDVMYVGTRDGQIFKKDNSLTGLGEENELPTEFNLAQNYPNPFNPTTKIEFSIPAAGAYSLVVYNILGQEVRVLANSEFQPGKYTVDFSASDLSSGIYIYRFMGQNVSYTKKMILIK